MAVPDGAEKKRKRQGDDGTNPSKKTTASTFPTGRIKIKHLARDAHWTPIIASTPGLALPRQASFQAYTRDTSRETSRGTRAGALLLHSSEHPTIDYTARGTDATSTDSLLQHYVGVYDAGTHELQVVPAERMSIRSSVRAEDEQVRAQQVERAGSVMDKRRVLGEEFGTKKAKKALNALRDNAVSSITRGTSPDSIARAIADDPSARAVLAAVAAKADGSVTRESMQAAIDADKPRPKRNVEAQTVDEVYTAEALVETDMLEALKVRSWVEDTGAGKEILTSSRFVSHRIGELVAKRLDDEHGAITRLKSAKYMLVLLELYGACRKQHSGGRELPPRDKLQQKMQAEPGVLQKVVKRFSQNGLTKPHSVMTKRLVDKLIMHLCAISLIVDYWESDSYDLREDLGLSTPEMQKYFAEVGARMTAMSETERQRHGLTKGEASMHRMVRLKLPLVFPKERVVPRSKRR